MRSGWLSFFFCLAILCGCSNEENLNDIVTKIDADFVWDLKNPQRSPEIHLSNIPEETMRLDFHFFDATNEWEHGGGRVLYEGSNVIRAGALKEFKGISSSWGVPKIRLVVEAFNKQNQLVGSGVVTKIPPKS